MLKNKRPVTSTSNTKNSGVSIAVVICTHNRPAVLERCLRRLREVDHAASVAVVDSAPNSSEAKLVAARYGARYHISPLKGLSRARNIGTRATDADIIAYLDDDMVPHAAWRASLTAEFADKAVMAATGPVLPLEFTDASDVELQLVVEVKPWGLRHFQIDQSSRQWFERTNFGGVGDGNFALRRSAFDQMRGFDERIGRGATIDSGEEHYAFFRVVELGFKIAYTPHAIVFHRSPTMGCDALRKQVADMVAYSAFLAWNHPFKSWRIAKFFVEAVFSTRRWWRSYAEAEVISMSFREKLVNGMNGFAIFFRSVRQTPKE